MPTIDGISTMGMISAAVKTELPRILRLSRSAMRKPMISSGTSVPTT